jgi:hypothetical protein
MSQSKELTVPEFLSVESRILTVDEYRHLRDAVGWGNGDPDAQSVGG